MHNLGSIPSRNSISGSIFIHLSYSTFPPEKKLDNNLIPFHFVAMTAYDLIDQLYSEIGFRNIAIKYDRKVESIFQYIAFINNKLHKIYEKEREERSIERANYVRYRPTYSYDIHRGWKREFALSEDKEHKPFVKKRTTRYLLQYKTYSHIVPYRTHTSWKKRSRSKKQYLNRL